MAATAMTLSGSAVATPANRLSSSAAIRSSELQQQQLGIVRTSAKISKIVATRSSSNDEVHSSKKPQILVALVAAGAALALNATPVSPANAGLFGGDTKVERGATAPNFPGNEGTGTKVGDNASVRGAASSGTPLGEAAGGSKIGDNNATRGSASTGTPLGEASKNGSGVDIGASVAEKAKDAVETGIDINIDPLKTKISDINPLKGTLNPATSDAN
ncbi:hypothetical protein KC19_7G054800 [Ceratodon purpureus]|uniref:Uncharacterized protein n=1 Tax=Ceratodon purpureus TaxID=3225 RepID=A0A8T0H338_CERPU|nr:hypothetical protein KC19_7G054800 [Ceratodon purpureus]